MTETSQETLIYLYGIVGADAPTPAAGLRGVENAEVRLVESGDVAAVVSDVPESIYGEEALNGRLDDLSWVGNRGVAHERVLDWFADQTPIIPLSLFSLHSDEERLKARVAAQAGDYGRLLEALSGKKQWGIRLWRNDEEAREGVDRVSPSLMALSEQIEAAPRGRRFLLEKKRETMRAEELRMASQRLAHEIYAALGEIAVAARRIPPGPGVQGERPLLLDGAFLVEDSRFADFQAAVNEQAARLVDSGFVLEFTGPWPPYHFSDLDDG